MKVKCDFLWTMLHYNLLSILVWAAMPYVGGVWYALCGDHAYEQKWLDGATYHLKLMRASCDDADLLGILDYTIARYARVGAWNVMVAPCVGGSSANKTVGLNLPHSPGITIDPEVLSWTAEESALLVVHEAMHDYYPFFGHAHIDPRMAKLWQLSTEAKRHSL